MGPEKCPILSWDGSQQGWESVPKGAAHRSSSEVDAFHGWRQHIYEVPGRSQHSSTQMRSIGSDNIIISQHSSTQIDALNGKQQNLCIPAPIYVDALHVGNGNINIIQHLSARMRSVGSDDINITRDSST